MLHVNIDLKKSQISISYNISQKMDISKNCSRKQNLIFLFKKEKKEKENRNSSWRKNIDEKVSMYHRDKVSRNIVYKLYMCAHIGQT